MASAKVLPTQVPRKAVEFRGLASLQGERAKLTPSTPFPQKYNATALVPDEDMILIRRGRCECDYFVVEVVVVVVVVVVIVALIVIIRIAVVHPRQVDIVGRDGVITHAEQ
jgi:hypothetical protein